MRPIEYELVTLASELEALKSRRESLQEQSVLRAQLAEHQKSLTEMRLRREESETKASEESSHSVEPQSKWFSNGRMPTKQEILDSKNRAEMLQELDGLFKPR